MPLTDARVRSLKVAPSPSKHSDGGGLHLLISPQGSKLWRLAYRFGGKQKTLALGIYPTVTLTDARQKREGAKRLLASGIDPSHQAKLERSASGHRAPTPLTLWRTSSSTRWSGKAKREHPSQSECVRTKNRKTFTSDFFPVGDDFEAISFRLDRIPDKAAAVRARRSAVPRAIGPDGHFAPVGLDRSHRKSAGSIRRIFRKAFVAAGLPHFKPHSFRDTLETYGERNVPNVKALKAWSQFWGTNG